MLGQDQPVRLILRFHSSCLAALRFTAVRVASLRCSSCSTDQVVLKERAAAVQSFPTIFINIFIFINISCVWVSDLPVCVQNTLKLR